MTDTDNKTDTTATVTSKVELDGLDVIDEIFITMITHDETYSIKLSEKSCNLSKHLKNLIQQSADKQNIVYSINDTKINSKILDEFKKYMDYHSTNEPEEIKKPIPSSDLSSFIKCKFDVDFVNDKPSDDIVLLFTFGNYIDCPSLVELMACKIASCLKSKHPNELMEYFGIESEPTEEQKKIINEELQTQFSDAKSDEESEDEKTSDDEEEPAEEDAA